MVYKIANKKMFLGFSIFSLISIFAFMLAIAYYNSKVNFLKNSLIPCIFIMFIFAFLPILLLMVIREKEKKFPLNCSTDEILTIKKILIPVLGIQPVLLMISILGFEPTNLNKAMSLTFGFLGIFSFYIGKHVKDLPINNLIGLRNKYTLNNLEVWQKTNLLCSKLTILFAGIFVFFSILFASEKISDYSLWGLYVFLITIIYAIFYTLTLHLYSKIISNNLSK